MDLLKQNNPPLANALLSGDFEKFSTIIREMQRIHRQKEVERLRVMTEHPFNIEAQGLIAEEIKWKNIKANMEEAEQTIPESLTKEKLPFISCRLNGFSMHALVDTGAQISVMSRACAESCNLDRLIDTRFPREAEGVGVGTQKIIWRIHMVKVEIASAFLTTSFSILENLKVDMLLGVDLLRRYDCLIDLRRNCLKIGTTHTEVPFLCQAELLDSPHPTSKESDSPTIQNQCISDTGGEVNGSIQQRLIDQAPVGTSTVSLSNHFDLLESHGPPSKFCDTLVGTIHESVINQGSATSGISTRKAPDHSDCPDSKKTKRD